MVKRGARGSIKRTQGNNMLKITDPKGGSMYQTTGDALNPKERNLETLGASYMLDIMQKQ